MTPQTDIFPKVRALLNDETTPYRWKDSELLGWVDECLDVLVDIRPDLFNSIGEHTCVTGAEQELVLPRVRQFQEVTRIVGGGAVLPTNRVVLDQFKPGWYSDTQAAALNWMPHPESFKKFYLYPPSPDGQVVEVRYVQAHQSLASVSDAINLPENYAAAITAYVVARSEAKDDEQINANRMQQFLSDFDGMVKGGG